MDIFNSDFWKQQWEAVVTAPFIMLPPIAIAAWAGWWLKGTLSEGTISFLKTQLEQAKDRKPADEGIACCFNAPTVRKIETCRRKGRIRQSRS